MNPDGTLDAEVIETACAADRVQLTVALPTGLDQALPAGRYFLARCGAQSWEERLTQWSIYVRRPLYAGEVRRLDDEQAAWTLSATAGLTDAPIGLTDVGIAWLSRRLPGERINLIGPLGTGFPQPDPSQNTLLAVDLRHLPIMQPLIEAALDRRGRVTLIVRADDDVAPDALHKGLPIAVELRLARTLDELAGHLQETLLWADRLCAALPDLDSAKLADLIRQTRLRVEPEFAYVLVQADLLCGSGACLACVVPTAGGGLTRACVHGPVFDLTRLG
jgi:hypothetical protein